MWYAGQLEIACVVQQTENVIGVDELPRDAGLPGIGTQVIPESFLPFGMVGQPWRRTADTNVRGPVEFHRRARRRRDLQQDQSPLGMLNRFEGERHAGLQHPRQPEFERLAPTLCGTRFEPGSGDDLIAVSHSPHDIAEVPALDPRRIGQGGDQLSDDVRIGIVLLELRPRRFGRKAPQIVDQGQDACVRHGYVSASVAPGQRVAPPRRVTVDTLW